MAQPGQTIRNGKLEVTFTQTSAMTKGELLEMEATYGGGSSVPPAHFHPNQTETFLVRQGSLHFVVNGDPRDVKAGEQIQVPPGAVHRVWNPNDQPARTTWQTRPALRSERFFEAQAVLAGEHVPLTKLGKLLQRAAIASRFSAEFQLASFGMRVMLAVLGVVGRLAGYKSEVGA